MYKIKKQTEQITRIYSRERLETVKCINCNNSYQIKITEHETNINKEVTKYETLHDIFCNECGTAYIGINFI